MRQLDRHLVWLLLGAFWVVVPLLDVAGPVRSAVHLAVVALAGVLLSIRIARSPRPVLGMPAAMPLLCALSLAVALATRRPDFPSHEMGGAALTGFAHVMLFLLVAALVPSVREAGPGRATSSSRWLAVTLGALVVTQLGVALFGPIDDGGRLVDDQGGRLAGTLGNPNVLGSVLAAAALTLAALRRWTRGAVLGALVLGGVVLVTGSRGAVAAGGIMTLVFVWRRRPAWAVGLVLVAAALLWLVPNPFTDRVLALQTGHTYPRPFLWKVATVNAAEHPLGIGPAMNKYVFPAHASHPDFPWLLHQRHAVGLTHNVFLTLALEWGWLAGGAALALLVWAARRLAPRRPQGSARPFDPLLQAAALGAGVLLLELQVDGLEQNAPVFTLALVLGGVALRRLPQPVAGPRVPAGLVAAAVVMVSGVLGYAAWDRVTSWLPQQAASAAVAAHAAGEVDLAEARAALERAAAAAPGDPAPARARLLLEGARLRDLIFAGAPAAETEPAVAATWAALIRARAANPVDPRLVATQVELLRLLWIRGDGGTAARVQCFAAYEALLALDPLDVVARLSLVRDAHRAGAWALRRRHFEQLVAIEPDDAVAWGTWAAWREQEGDPEEALWAWVRCEEAIQNCRVKVAVDNPRSRMVFERILEQTDIDAVRERIATLRRALYL